MSAFFYGYIVTQLPAGYWTNKYGGKLFFGFGIGLCAIFSLLIPLAEKLGPIFVILLRILQGLSQGVIYPSMHCLLSKWSPQSERSRLTTFAFSGSYIGTVVAMSLGGYIMFFLLFTSILIYANLLLFMSFYCNQILCFFVSNVKWPILIKDNKAMFDEASIIP